MCDRPVSFFVSTRVSHSLPVSCLQRLQRGGGPVHLVQRAVAALPARAGEGRGDLALPQVAEALQLSEGRRHLLHFGDGGGRLGMSFIIGSFFFCLFFFHSEKIENKT